MASTIQKTITTLNRKIEDLENVQTDKDFSLWKIYTTTILEGIFDKSESALVNFKLISYSNSYIKEERLHYAKIECKNLLSAISETVDAIGIPKFNNMNSNTNKNSNKIKIKNSTQQEQEQEQKQSQEQSQEVEILLKTIFKAVDSKLTGDQREELKAILDSPDSEEAKKLQFVDKIKSFGSDVASGILATLLTNPAVYAGIANMF